MRSHNAIGSNRRHERGAAAPVDEAQQLQRNGLPLHSNSTRSRLKFRKRHEKNQTKHDAICRMEIDLENAAAMAERGREKFYVSRGQFKRITFATARVLI